MRNRNLLFLVLLVLTCGLIAAGCGDDDSSTTDSEATTTEEASTTEDSSTAEETTEDTTESSSGEVDSDGFYDACIDVVEGTPAESAGTTACEQARTGLEQCATQAEALPEGSREDALAACQEAAESAIDTLEAAG